MPAAATPGAGRGAAAAVARAALALALAGAALLGTGGARATEPGTALAPAAAALAPPPGGIAPAAAPLAAAGPGPAALPLSQAPGRGGAGEAAAATASTTLIGAGRWHRAGFSGHGVRVGLLDAGFAGYEEALGATLPPTVIARSFRADGDLAGGTDHGLRAAEVVHAVAPRAELYLVNFSSLDELGEAIDYLVEEQVAIVSFSLGFVHSGPGDGTGQVNDVVTRGAEAGQLWAVAAGNWGLQHWSGTFVDANGDSRHEFAGDVSRVRHNFEAGDLITVSLRWDDRWGAACSDYDLELFAPDGSLVRAGRHMQDCDDDPVEVVQVLATQSGTYSVGITGAGGGAPHLLSLLVLGAPDRGYAIDRPVPRGSLAEPADHPLVLTVGALDPRSVEVVALPSSSRGPTSDGRPKPDLIAPAGFSSALSGGFGGTSAAAPHVAGAAALLKEALPGADRGALASELRGRAVSGDAGAAESGAGLLHLGSLAGLGLLRPVGADEAVLEGVLPEGDGLGALVYRGPDGYPIRFAHLLTPPGRPPVAVFRRGGAGRWDAYIRGAPAVVQSLLLLNSGDELVIRLGGP